MTEKGRVPVEFQPSGAIAWIAPGTSVLDAARAAGVVISAPCGGRGVCGMCGVRVLAGELAPATDDELNALRHAPAGVRLACRAAVHGPATVRPIVVNSTQSAPSAALQGDSPIAMGVDLGTTTVSATAVDLTDGRQLGSSIVLNRQQTYGADVLSRISAALDGHDTELRRLAEESVLAAIDAAAPGARGRVSRVVVAANVAMTSLLAGADVSSLAAHPFTPPEGCTTLGEDSGLACSLPAASLRLVAPIAGFVGGDALAGIAVLESDPNGRPRLLVDMGTNAEVALDTGESMWVASAAAGPAFEGGGISCGCPASAEAVRSVSVDSDGAIALESDGEVEPAWFSGAGLVSAVAALRRVGHIGPDGRMVSAGPLEQRFGVDRDGVLGVALGAPGGCLAITQQDVRALQLAKAAVRVAIDSVLRRGGVAASELGSLFVAGAFGAALDPSDLVDLGIVPRQAADAVVYAGNSALRGATAMAMDPGLIEAAEARARVAVLVDLASEKDFSARLMEAVALEPYEAATPV